MKHCQACKAEWLDESPYCYECGFHAFVQTGVDPTRVINRTRQQMLELERERERDREMLRKAKTLLTRLLTSYETATYSGSTTTDVDFDVNLSDSHKFLQELGNVS